MAQREDPVLQQFFYRPMARFGVRELGRITKLDTKTVMHQLRKLMRRKIVLRKKERKRFAYYEANRLSIRYRFAKSHALIQRIIDSGVIEFLERELQPDAMVLFGSAQKGTYHQKSDIDIFVLGKRKRLDLTRFERSTGHPLQILFDTNFANLPTGLAQNIYNGIVLSGKLRISP